MGVRAETGVFRGSVRLACNGSHRPVTAYRESLIAASVDSRIRGMEYPGRIPAVDPGMETGESFRRLEVPALFFGHFEVPWTLLVAEDVRRIILLITGYEPLDGTEDQVVILCGIVKIAGIGVVAPVCEVDEHPWVLQIRPERRPIGEMEPHFRDLLGDGTVAGRSRRFDIPVFSRGGSDRIELLGQRIGPGTCRCGTGRSDDEGSTDRFDHRSSGSKAVLHVWSSSGVLFRHPLTTHDSAWRTAVIIV